MAKVTITLEDGQKITTLKIKSRYPQFPSKREDCTHAQYLALLAVDMIQTTVKKEAETPQESNETAP